MYYDLTLPITPNTVVYPGDPSYKEDTVQDVAKGSLFTLKTLHFGNHTGTHIDFPAHVIKGGKTSSDYNINDLIGKALIIDIPYGHKCITTKHVSEINPDECDFVFFKTQNTQFLQQQFFKHDHVYLEKAAAEILVAKGIKIVGIDYISIDSSESDDLIVHNLLLSSNVLIVENLSLSHIKPGFYKAFISPLNIPNMDGLPVRVIAKPRHAKIS